MGTVYWIDANNHERGFATITTIAAIANFDTQHRFTHSSLLTLIILGLRLIAGAISAEQFQTVADSHSLFDIPEMMLTVTGIHNVPLPHQISHSLCVLCCFASASPALTISSEADSSDSVVFILKWVSTQIITKGKSDKHFI